MPLFNTNALTIALLTVFFVVMLLDLFFVPLVVYIVYFRKIDKLINQCLPQEGRQFAAERFFKRKRPDIKQLLGTRYIYLSAFCEDVDSNYETIVNGTIKGEYKYVQNVNFALAAAMMWFVRGNAEKAEELCKKVKTAPPKKPSPLLQSGLQICEIFLFEKESEQFQKISEFMQDNENSSNLSPFRKSILYFRQYQLSGQKELIERCLAAGPNELTRKTLLALASGASIGGDAT